ncbi:acyl-CoA thioesterase [Planctomonas psychrotolerans]|uniref:acyl-CoA thioesterase n=1 Tax=Planctomonas psychrotolerans TaxID=2528712 RepID=UPI0012388394|nr:thioesterase family protein [Planctomonas psychrotolerans]
MTRLHVPIRLRWSDLDAYGHVNNAEMLRLLEEARIQAFWATDDATDAHGPEAVGAGSAAAVLDGTPGADTLTLIARQEIEYLAPVPYLRHPLDIQLWLGRLGGASLEVCYEVHSPRGVQPAVLYARAVTTIVLVDTASERPRRINEVERAAWSPYLEDPVVFTQRV